MFNKENHISICVPTFNRNRMLERLIRSLALQETEDLFSFSIVVIDNAPGGPAQKVVERLRKELGLEIAYGMEPVQTIPAARNHGLRLAHGKYIGILDDDEFAPRHWLVTLYRAIQTFEVEGALGPVNPFFEKEPPVWLVKSQFCERKIYQTGTILQWDQTRTGNVLIKREVFDQNNLWFDENYKTGGSDREFFKQAMKLGCRFVAVEEAPVYETVPPERWTKKYYLKRALVNGFNSYKNIKGQGNKFTAVIDPLKSIGALMAYALAFPIYLFVGTHMIMRVLEKGGHHMSHLLAMLGIELVKKRNF
ncbi:MAG: glycosyltransferase family A protein [Thermodesulfobacteriota bacterium]